MEGIFCINNNPLKIITKYAKKDFVNQKVSANNYTDLQNSIILILKKKKEYELKELLLETEMYIQHHEVYNFDVFMGTRLALYSLILAVTTILFTSTELQKRLNISIEQFLSFGFMFLFFVLITYRYTENKQKEVLVYYKFRLRCLNNIMSKSLK